MATKTDTKKMPTPEELANIIPVAPTPAKAAAPSAKAEPKGLPNPDSRDVELAASEPVMVSTGTQAPPILTHDLAEPPKPPASRSRANGRGRASAAAPTAAAKQLQKLLPSGVRVHVNKRRENGAMSFIGDYSANDVAGSGSMERFIKEHIVPSYGYGEFALYLQRPNKAELEPVATVNIEAPLDARRPGGGDTKELVELFMKQQQLARDEAAKRKTPLEELTDTLAMLKTMGLAGNEEKSSMDPMMMMMMMQMQKPAAAPSGPDPLMLKLIERLDRMEEDRFIGGPNMLPPPPPPPQQDNSMEGFAMIMKAMADQASNNTALLIEAMKGNQAPRDPVQDLATLTKLTAAGDDRMTTKDFFTMLPTIKGLIAPESGKNSITDALETMRTMKVLEREFSPQHDPNAEQASSFWDFLKGLVQSDAGARIADAVMAKQQAQQVEARHDQRRMTAESAADAARPQEQPQQPQEQEGVGIPDSYEKHAMNLSTAATAPERLKAGIEGLQHLAMYPEFRQYVATIFGHAKMNKKIECLDFSARFLGSLVQAEALQEEPAQKFLEDLEEHWDLVRSTLGMPDIPEVFPEGHEPEEEEEPAPSGEYELEDSAIDEERPPVVTPENDHARLESPDPYAPAQDEEPEATTLAEELPAASHLAEVPAPP